MFNRIKNKLSQSQFIALGFFLIILVGTVLLMLPVSSKDGTETSFLEALFTAVSTTCVTGLVVVDTYTHWSLFGQLVIITLIQIGGLGFMTIGVMFAIILKRKVSLKDRGLLQESVNTLQIGGIVRLAKKIVIGTLLVEGIGAIILASRFIGMYGVAEGIYYGIFHSISAFCNAGFDLFGRYAEYNSLCCFEGDWIINITVSLLILIGGIGFVVWDDITIHKHHLRKYSLHSKIVLSFTLFLTLAGTILFLAIEWNHSFKDMDLSTKLCAAFFSSVTPRTAGFNTVDTAALTNGSKLLTMLFMFIGGSPGSTAGGVKTTTLFVILIYLWCSIKNKYGIEIFNRRLQQDVVKKATLVISVNAVLFITASIIIMSIQPELGFSDVLFETISAISTVGMTTSITRNLCDFSRILIILLMYCGRIGSLSFALSFNEKQRVAPILQPEEKINIG